MLFAADFHMFYHDKTYVYDDTVTMIDAAASQLLTAANMSMLLYLSQIMAMLMLLFLLFWVITLQQSLKS